MLITVIVPVSATSGKATCKKSALARTASQTHMVLKKKKNPFSVIPSPGFFIKVLKLLEIRRKSQYLGIFWGFPALVWYLEKLKLMIIFVLFEHIFLFYFFPPWTSPFGPILFHREMDYQGGRVNGPRRLGTINILQTPHRYWPETKV